MKIFSYKKFMFERLNENVQQAKSYLLDRAKKTGTIVTPEVEKKILNDEDFLEIKKLLNANPNWTNVFVRFHYEDGVSLDDLKILYLLLKQKKNSLNNLPQPVDKYYNLSNKSLSAYKQLMSDLDELDSNILVKRFVSNLPGEFTVKNADKPDYKEKAPSLRQKYASATAEQKEKIKDIAIKFNKLGNNEKESKYLQSLFWAGIKKWRNLDEVINKAYEHIESCKNNNVSKLLLEIARVNSLLGKSKGAVILYNKDNIVIFQVFSFEANKIINCSCNHCIVDSIESWKNYTSDNSCQFYIWDFSYPTSKKQIIGVTVDKNDNIKEATYKNNERIEKGDFIKLMRAKKIPWHKVIKNRIFDYSYDFEEVLTDGGNLVSILDYLSKRNIDYLTDIQYKEIVEKVMEMSSETTQRKKVRLEILDLLFSSNKFSNVYYDYKEHPLVKALLAFEDYDVVELLSKQKTRIDPDYIDSILYGLSFEDEFELAINLFGSKPDLEIAIATNSIELIEYMASRGDLPEKDIDLMACLKKLDEDYSEKELETRLNLIALLIHLGYKVRDKDKRDLDTEIKSGFEPEFDVRKKKTAPKKPKKDKVEEQNKKLVDAESTLQEIKSALDNGADPNYENGKALLNAILDADEDKVELLLKAGAKIKSDFFSYANRRNIRELLDKYS